jgi:predicted DNA-binding protein
MADGEIRVKLDAETERRLKEMAEAAGRSVDDYVHGLIADKLDEDGWGEDEHIADEAERTGTSYSVEEAMSHFREELHKRVKKAR